MNGINGQMLLGQDFAQKRFLRNVNRKSGAFSSNRIKGNEL